MTREKPSESWLPFLNVQVQLLGGRLTTKWYRKPSNKNIIVDYRSAHPTRTKKAVIRNMFNTAAEVCSGEQERRESLKLAREIAAQNVYISSGTLQRGRHNRENKEGTPEALSNKIPFLMPFISDEVSTSIRKCLRRAGLDESVVLTELPPVALTTGW